MALIHLHSVQWIPSKMSEFAPEREMQCLAFQITLDPFLPPLPAPSPNLAGCGRTVPPEQIPPACSTRRVSGPRILLHWKCVNLTAHLESCFIGISVVVFQQEAKAWTTLGGMKLLTQALMEGIWEAQTTAALLLLWNKRTFTVQGCQSGISPPHTHTAECSSFLILFIGSYPSISGHWFKIRTSVKKKEKPNNKEISHAASRKNMLGKSKRVARAVCDFASLCFTLQICWISVSTG